MKISVVTVVLNNQAYIEDCIRSVVTQKCDDTEYIVIDGGSTDGTIAKIRKYGDSISHWQSDPDKGIYDAMNKGIRATTGDVIGILNSDDFYATADVLQSVVDCLSDDNVATCYGDLAYIEGDDIGRRVRYWKSGNYDRNRFKTGWMPPHPTFFAKRRVYEEFGLFDLRFPLAADYELMFRFLYKHGVSCAYIPKTLVTMRTGGKCKPGLFNTMHNVVENYRAWTVNGLRPNPLTFAMKPLSKTVQYIRRS